MYLDKDLNKRFDLALSNVRKTSQQLNCSGAAVFIIHTDKIVTEEYWGRHSKEPSARQV